MLPELRYNATDRRSSRLVIALAIVVVVTSPIVSSPYVTFAFAQDTSQSAKNTLQAGSFDGKLSEIGPATENSTTDERDTDQIRDTWEDYSHTNGTTDPVNNTINISNVNTSYSVDQVNITASYTENDSALLDNGNAGNTAQTLNITTFRYNGTSHLGSIPDANSNGATDLDDLAQSTIPVDGIPVNDSVSLTIELAGDASSNENIGGDDGIDFTVSFTLLINESWSDTDQSTQNTIQYTS